VFNSVIQSIKRLFFPKKGLYGLLFDMLGLDPNNPDIYQLAFVHKSASLPKLKGANQNNERLEYLGDAILGAITADVLYKYFPNKDEGFLTQVRSKIVSRESLNLLASKLELDKYVMSNVCANNNKHVFGDAFEALVGAIYLDQGYLKTKDVIENHIFKNFIDIEQVVTVDKNFKSKLIEWAQKNKKDLTFETNDKGYEKDTKLPLFIAEVSLDTEIIGSGTGYSKKEAQQKASEQALTSIHVTGDLAVA